MHDPGRERARDERARLDQQHRAERRREDRRCAHDGIQPAAAQSRERNERGQRRDSDEARARKIDARVEHSVELVEQEQQRDERADLEQAACHRALS